MRAPLSWIREFTPVDAPVPELVAALNQLGLEVESVEQPGEEITGVVAGKVLAVTKHPDADKLSLVDVDFGAGETRVVCGAPNVVAGMVAPYAPAGATLPGGFTLERRKIRGVVSDGMLLSARELGLGDDHSGIVNLDATSRARQRRPRHPRARRCHLRPVDHAQPARRDVHRRRGARARGALQTAARRARATGGCRRRDRQRHLRGDRRARPLSPVPRSRGAGHDGGVSRVDGAAARESRACGRSATSSTSPTTCCSNATSRCTRSTSHGSAVAASSSGSPTTASTSPPSTMWIASSPPTTSSSATPSARRRPSPGSWAGPPPRSATPPRRSCSSRPTSTGWGSRRRRSA